MFFSIFVLGNFLQNIAHLGASEIYKKFFVKATSTGLLPCEINVLIFITASFIGELKNTLEATQSHTHTHTVY